MSDTLEVYVYINYNLEIIYTTLEPKDARKQWKLLGKTTISMTDVPPVDSE